MIWRVPLLPVRTTAAIGWAVPVVLLAAVTACDRSKEAEPPADVRVTEADAAAARKNAAPGETLVTSRKLQGAFGAVRIDQFDEPEGAHADGGRLAVIYLDTGKEYPKAVEGGTFGSFGDWSVDPRFAANPVIVSKSGGTWQGYTCTWTDLTELRAEGPVRLARFEDSFDDSGAATDKPQSVQGKIVAVERDRSFTVQFEGTRQFTAVYNRKGNSYELQGGDDRKLDGC